MPKLLALSWDILYNGCKGLSSSLLPKIKNTIDSYSKMENTVDSSLTCFYVLKELLWVIKAIFFFLIIIIKNGTNGNKGHSISCK